LSRAAAKVVIAKMIIRSRFILFAYL
jgi:hypothetical protein